MIQAEAGAEHDAQQIHRVRQRLLQLGAVALHQAVEDLLRQNEAEQRRRHQAAEQRHRQIRFVLLQIDRAREQRCGEHQHEDAVQCERALAADARLRKQLLHAVHPVLTAGHKRDEVKRAVQSLRTPLAARSARGAHHCLRLQALQAIAERVFLVLEEELEAGPQQQAEGAAREYEDEEVQQHGVVSFIPLYWRSCG